MPTHSPLERENKISGSRWREGGGEGDEGDGGGEGEGGGGGGGEGKGVKYFRVLIWQRFISSLRMG